MKKQLLITLKSDMCVSSGFSYIGTLDKDVCYDRWGFPYIPARRIKGCLKDIAQQLLYSFFSDEDIDFLFGKKSNFYSGSLRINNAHPYDYERLIEEIKYLRGKENGEVFFSQQQVLAQYTHIVAHGSAKKEKNGTYGYMHRDVRVVNHYAPSEKKEEMIFVSGIEFDDEYLEKITYLMEAFKNIGHRRNRGLGAISCRLIDVEDQGTLEVYLRNNKPQIYDENSLYSIRYYLKNDEPLMLSGKNDTRSEKSISGQSILGFAANKYLEINGKDAASSEAFEDLFLNGITKYVSAYPAKISDSGELIVFYPAPLYINQFKKSENFVNTLFDIPKEENVPGNNPKKLKEKFLYKTLAEDEEKIEIKEVDIKLHLHRRRGQEESFGGLYSYEAIESGQLFAGEIHTIGKYVDTIIDIFDNADVYVGKSKSAQYGHCSCSVLNNIERVTPPEEKKGDIVATFLTDGIFTDDYDFCGESNFVGLSVCNELSISPKKIEPIFETSIRSGFNSSWGMHKPLIPVIKAGSSIVFRDCEMVSLPEFVWVGEKNQEGFGYIHIEQLSSMKVSPKLAKSQDEKTNAIEPQKLRTLAYQILSRALLDSLIKSRPIDLGIINGSQINRFFTMLTQSRDFLDFKNRIESIKNNNMRRRLCSRIIAPINNFGIPTISFILQDKKCDLSESNILYNRLLDLGYTDEKISEDIWREYLGYYLTITRYKSKGEQSAKNSIQTDI